MNTRASVALLAVLLTAATGAPGQDIPLSSRLSYRDITITLPDGTVARGRLIAAVRLLREAGTTVPDGYGGGSTFYGTAEGRKTLLSGVAFGALQFPLTRVLSIGLAADYTLIPAVDIPALPDNGLAGQTMGLSNGSVGFVLGYHF